MNDKDIERIRDASARIGENFGDYLILVRVKDGYCWKASDETWGLGAAERFVASVKDSALIARIEAMEGE